LACGRTVDNSFTRRPERLFCKSFGTRTDKIRAIATQAGEEKNMKKYSLENNHRLIVEYSMASNGTYRVVKTNILNNLEVVQ
jgi:hypothetical protein